MTMWWAYSCSLCLAVQYPHFSTDLVHSRRESSRNIHYRLSTERNIFTTTETYTGNIRVMLWICNSCGKLLTRVVRCRGKYAWVIQLLGWLGVHILVCAQKGITTFMFDSELRVMPYVSKSNINRKFPHVLNFCSGLKWLPLTLHH